MRRCGRFKGGEGLADEGLDDGLKNNVRYAVAVAGYDAVGNRGNLSTVVCGTPQQVDDFFEIYRKSGGEAGGGLCACDLPGVGRGLPVVGGSAACTLAFFGLRRVRRSRARRAR